MNKLDKIQDGQILTCTKEQFCWVMETWLQDDDNRYKKGLSVFYTNINLKTGQLINPPTIHGVAYKMSSKDRGLLLHFCPICGTDLYKLFGKEKRCSRRGKRK